MRLHLEITEALAAKLQALASLRGETIAETLSHAISAGAQRLDPTVPAEQRRLADLTVGDFAALLGIPSAERARKLAEEAEAKQRAIHEGIVSIFAGISAIQSSSLLRVDTPVEWDKCTRAITQGFAEAPTSHLVVAFAWVDDAGRVTRAPARHVS